MRILRRLQRRLPRSQLTRRLALLVGSTALGQMALLAATPLVTRLYSPADYGVFVVQLALLSLLAVVTGLRYEAAIPLCRNDGDAGAVACLVIAISAAVALASLAVVRLAGPALGPWVGADGASDLLTWLPPLLVLQGLFLAFDGWALYQGRMRQLAQSKVAQGVVTAAAQVTLGVASDGRPWGLFLAYGLGQVAAIVPMLWHLSAAQRRLFLVPDVPRMRAMAREHWRFPVYEIWSRGLANAAEMLPITLVGAAFGAAASGMLGLAQRIAALPVRFVGISAAQVYIAELGRLPAHDRKAHLALFDATVRHMLIVGGCYLAAVVAAGPSLFALVFGEMWAESGTMARILAPMYLALFVNRPIRYTVQYHGRQDISLMVGAVSLLSVLAAFYATHLLGGGVATALALLSAALTATQLGSFMIARALAQGRITPGSGSS